MVLHHAGRLAFIHIPKCGGTSVEHVLCTQETAWLLRCVHRYLKNKNTYFARISSQSYYFCGKWWRALWTWIFAWATIVWLYIMQQPADPHDAVPFTNLLTHTPLSIRLSHNIPPREEWQTYRTFAIVRNPYDRLVSAYHQLQLDKVAYPFARFCEDARKECHTYLSKRDGRFLFSRAANVFFLPQYVFVCDAAAKRCIVDRILHFETLQHDWQTMRREWHLHDWLPSTLPHANKQGPVAASNAAACPTKYWTPTLREMIYTTYRRDFEWFGYTHT